MVTSRNKSVSGSSSASSSVSIKLSLDNDIAPSSRPSSAASSARPFSASNLSATIANARFKTFQVQYEILCKNPILCAIAHEIPWKNLLELFVLKFFAVGDVLWQQGEQPHELAFVLCGGFLARRIESTTEVAQTTTEVGVFSSDNSGSDKKDVILAEKMVKPGGTLAAWAVHTNTPLPYTIVTAKFKSILVALPVGKYKSIRRQLIPSTNVLVEELIYANDNQLLQALNLPPLKALLKSSKTSSSSKGKHLSTNAREAHLHQHVSIRASTTSALTKSSSTVTLDDTASWASLQVTKPVEYEVNSSLLILHQSKSTGNLHLPSSSSSSLTKTSKHSMIQQRSTATRLIAKKHTQRRLESIKLPLSVDPFPPRHRQSRALEGQANAKHVDVVPKVCIGRLLQPLKKPAMLDDDDDENEIDDHEPTGSHSDASLCYSTKGRRVLVADRAEEFRDAW